VWVQRVIKVKAQALRVVWLYDPQDICGLLLEPSCCCLLLATHTVLTT